MTTFYHVIEHDIYFYTKSEAEKYVAKMGKPLSITVVNYAMYLHHTDAISARDQRAQEKAQSVYAKLPPSTRAALQLST